MIEFPVRLYDRRPEVKDGAVEVVTARLDVAPAVARDLESCLSGGERERARRFVVERDGRRWIAGRARLRQLLADRLGMAPEDVELARGPHGKPGLSPRMADPDLEFNMSRSGDLAAYAFSRGRAIGIDIEAVRDLRDADAVAARFFSPREIEDYSALRPGDKPLGFFNCWTRKEAYVKALGDGLAFPLDRFDVSLAPDEPARILRVDRTSGESCGWSLHALTPAPGFTGAVVVRHSGDEPVPLARFEDSETR